MQKLHTTIQKYLNEPESEEDSDLQVSPVDHVEVGIACVLCGHLEGLINILRGWSPVISTAVVEIADAGGWLNTSATNAAANGFSESDLLVLSYGGRRLRGVNCDEIVVQYADLLAKHAKLESTTPSGGLEGWQIALQVLRRVKNERVAHERMSKLLDKLDITDSTQVRFTASLCEKLALYEQSKQLSSVSTIAISAPDMSMLIDNKALRKLPHGHYAPLWRSCQLLCARRSKQENIRSLPAPHFSVSGSLDGLSTSSPAR